MQNRLYWLNRSIDMKDLMPYGGGPETLGASLAKMPTLKDRIDMAVNRAEEQLATAERCRELLDKNPDLEELMNLMQKGFF